MGRTTNDGGKPLKVFQELIVDLDQGVGAESCTTQTVHVAAQKVSDQKPPDGSADWVEGTPQQRAVRGTGHDGDVRHGASRCDRDDGNHAKGFSASESGVSKNQAAAPIGDPQTHLGTAKVLGQFVGDRIADDFEMALGTMSQRTRVIDRGPRLEFPVVGDRKVLQVDGVGPDHVPGAIDELNEGFCGDQLIGLHAIEERQFMIGDRGVKKIHIALSPNRRKAGLAGKFWNRIGGGDLAAAAIGGELPVVQ